MRLPAGLFCLLAALAACGSNDAASVTCSNDTTCLRIAGSLLLEDASADAMPRCCAGSCVLHSLGCDSGYRYLTAEPAFGDCAPAPMCSPQSAHDASAPDLSATDSSSNPVDGAVDQSSED